MDKKQELIEIINTDIFKSLDEEQRIFTCVALRPNVVDAHGDIYYDEAVKQAGYDFMEFCLNTSLQHEVELTKEDVAVVESYIAPIDMTLGSGEVKKGDWILSLRVHNDAIWEHCKSGTFKGLSVGVACTTYIPEESNDRC